MSGLEVFLGYLSGLRLLEPNLPLSTLLPTMFVVNTCDAFMCRLFARNNGYPPNLWFAVGFVFGIWAVAALILVPKRAPDLAAAGDDE
ncbi:MAG: hypothetical protein ACREQJ_00870 [Candidatus Binatia bacterium]